MKTPKHLTTLALLSLGLNFAIAGSLGTAFTYQGRLFDGSDPANGTYDLNFTLHDDASGIQIGPLVSATAVGVSNGLFTVTLDFGNVFDGNARWLAIAVKTNRASTYTALTPRQPITASPYALYAPSAGYAATATTATVATGVANNAVMAPGIASGQVVKSLNTLHDDVTLAVGANLTLTPNNRTLTLSSPADWHLSGNTGIAPGSDFLGTKDYQPLELKVNNERALRLEPTADTPNLIGGYQGNQVSSGITGATIAGGGGVGAPHLVGGIGGTVGGGAENQALGMVATVSGGQANVAGASGSTVGGGVGNTIPSSAPYGTIPGGTRNSVTAPYGYATGYRAKANHTGAFVWADSTEADFASTGVNQLLVRATGGVGLGVNDPQQQLDVGGQVLVRGPAFGGLGDSAQLFLGDGNHSIRSVWGSGL